MESGLLSYHQPRRHHFQSRRDSVSEGYFNNIGQTRRYGIESGAIAHFPQLFSAIDDWHFSTNYTYLNARFQDGFDIQHPTEVDCQRCTYSSHSEQR